MGLGYPVCIAQMHFTHFSSVSHSGYQLPKAGSVIAMLTLQKHNKLAGACNTLIRKLDTAIVNCLCCSLSLHTCNFCALLPATCCASLAYNYMPLLLHTSCYMLPKYHTMFLIATASGDAKRSQLLLHSLHSSSAYSSAEAECAGADYHLLQKGCACICAGRVGL